MRLLAQEPPAGEESVRTAAAAAGWTLPRGGVAALVAATARTGTPGEALLDSIAAPARPAARRGRARGRGLRRAAIVFIPDPDAPGRRRRLEAAVGERPVGARADVPWQRGRGERPARGARRSGWPRAAGCGRASSPPRAAWSWPTTISPSCCSPPTPTSPPTSPRRGSPRSPICRGPRARLTETLAAWLDRPGQVQAVAAALDVHPQTVRYRVRQLRDLFGDRLEDPDARFELALALRAAERALLPISPMRLLVTGAAGMLGHDVTAAAERAGHDVDRAARAEPRRPRRRRRGAASPPRGPTR